MESSLSPSISHIQSPLIRRLLGGNLAPSDDERIILAACRQNSRVRLTSINETIKAMNVQLAAMTEDAVQLSQELEVFDSVLHPVRRLPHEIIHHICQLAMEDLQSPSLEALASPDLIDSLSMRHPLWICAQVCHRWRYVVWNSPRVWTSVVLALHKPVTAFKLSLLLIDVLERTKGLPLSIALHSYEPIPSLAMPIVLQSCSHWQHATLSLTTKDFRLLSEMKHAFGEVRTLQLHLHDPQSVEQPMDAFSEAQGVHSLEMLYDVTPYFDLGWHRIERFTHQRNFRHALSGGEAKSILTRTSSIRVAEINLGHYLISIFAPPTNIVTVVVPSLRILTLREYPPGRPSNRGSGIASFMTAVHLPDLVSLTLDMQTVSPLGDLRGVSIPSILGLSLSVATFQPQDSEALEKFLAYAPSVQHFGLHVEGDVDLEWVFATDVFVEMPIHSMTFTAGGCMSISQTDGSSLAGDTFSSLWRKGVFETLSIHGISRVGDEVVTSLRGLVEEGLVLDMRDVHGALWRLNVGD